MSCAAVLMPMPGTPGTLSVGSPTSACTSTTLSGRHAELLDHLGLADDALRAVAGLPFWSPDAGSNITTPGRTSCIRSLSEETISTSAPRLAGLAGIGGDDVVGLVAVLLDRDQAEGPHGLAHQRELRHQLGRRLGRLRLVGRVDLLAERLLRLVEDDGEMRRLDADRAVADELQSLVQNSRTAPVGRPSERYCTAVLVHRLEIGPEDEGRAVDEEDVVALLERTRHGHGSLFSAAGDHSGASQEGEGVAAIPHPVAIDVHRPF